MDKTKRKNRLKSGNAVRLFWCKSNVKKLSYQRSEVWMCQDVAVVCDSKCVPMDSQLETQNEIHEEEIKNKMHINKFIYSKYENS